MAWHLQGSQDSTRTWFIHGVVVRAAISLGLHLRSATDDLDEIEEETRIRVWYGCIALDRYPHSFRELLRTFSDSHIQNLRIVIWPTLGNSESLEPLTKAPVHSIVVGSELRNGRSRSCRGIECTFPQ